MSRIKLPVLSKALYSILLTLLSLNYSTNNVTYAAPPAIKVSVSTRDWNLALKGNIPSATLQVTLPTNIFDQDKDVFSHVFSRIPRLLPELKLNTLGRGMHSTFAYLDGLSLEAAKEVLRFFQSLDQETLAEYQLDQPVQVLDSDHIELVRIGIHSRFFAFKPHRDFVAFQSRFYRLLKDRAPEIYRKHLAHKNLGENANHADNVHMSLVQWGPSSGIELTPEQEKEVERVLLEEFKNAIDHYKATHQGRKPEIEFSFLKNPLELVTAPTSITSPPMALATYRLRKNGRPSVSSVMRWTVKDPESTELARVIEFDTEAWLAGDSTPYEGETVTDDRNDWLPQGLQFTPEPTESFIQKLSAEMKSAYLRALRNISPTKHPAPVPTEQKHRIGRFYITQTTHPRLAPQKAFEALETARKIGFQSTPEVSIGLALYASSVRSEVKSPGDSDLLVNALMHVPSTIKTYKEAEHHAIQVFVRRVFGQLKQGVNEKRIAITELRAGSTATMGLGSKSSVEDLEDNPYLSETDVMNGSYTDTKGRPWTLENLIALGDFVKGKVDLFLPEGRSDLSLQFNIGFEWNGAVFSLHRDGIKGIPPLLRTAVYDGGESFAIASTLSRAYSYYSVQKGPLLPRAIHSLYYAAFGHSIDQRNGALQPLWNSKFIKKFYNFLILLRQGGLGHDEIFFKETARILKREGKWKEGYSVEGLVERLIAAINQPELRDINGFKRNVNDIAEFNERGQAFTVDQWLARLAEFETMIQNLDAISTSNSNNLPENFRTLHTGFVSLYKKLQNFTDAELATQYLSKPRLLARFKKYETALTHLDGKIVGRLLLDEDLDFIQTLVMYAPVILLNYERHRSQESEEKSDWELRFLDLQTTDQAKKVLSSLIEQYPEMDRQQFFSSYQSLLNKPSGAHPNPCVDELTQK